MFRLLLPAFLFFGFVLPALAQNRPSGVMLRYPDVSADQIVFRYDGDLWLVPKTGGDARRLTSSGGNEDFPKFSPDGKSVAFVASYDGGRDLYVLATDGGVPERVTYHPQSERLSDWHPSGDQLLYWSSEISGIARAPKVFLVETSGAQPSPLPMAYGTFGAIDGSGKWIAYTPTSREFSTWRRYRGGTAQDVWLFNLETNESRRLTDDPGTDSMPMWHGREVVFLSDRGAQGIMNLYAHDLDSDDVRALTTFTESGVRFPSMGPDDVVFEAMGELHRYEFATGKVVPVEVTIPVDRPRLRPRHRSLAGGVGGHGISPSAKRVVVEARGEVFTVPVEDGAARNLTHSDGVAERYPSWSPDGKWIAYWSDRSGEYELCLRRSDGKPFEGADEHGEKRITTLGPGWKYGASWAPDSEKLVFGLQSGELFLYDLGTKEQILIDTNPTYGPLGVQWSHDAAWIAWSREHSESHLGAIQLYDVVARAHHEVTSGMFNDSQPTFDAGGDWLFYASSRTFRPTYSDFDTTWIYTGSTGVVAVPLRADVESPWAPKNDEEPIADDEEKGGDVEKDEKEKDEKEGDKKEADKKEAEEPAPITIDLDGFESRAIVLPIEPGRIAGLTGLDGQLLYGRIPTRPRGGRGGGGDGGATLHLYDVAKQKDHEVLSGVRGWDLAAGGKKLLVLTRGGAAVIEPKPGQKAEDTIDFAGVAGTFDPHVEWRQILNDVYRIYRDWFYDPNLHGVDWKAVRDRALAALDSATSREDVTFLVGEMIAELNVGHAYNASGPEGSRPTPAGPSVGLLGCDWEATDGGYRVARILGADYDADARSPLAVHGVDAAVGDYLLAVNGVPVEAGRSIYAAFAGTAGRATVVTLNASPGRDGNERDVTVEPLGSERSLRYRDWVAGCRARALEVSGGRVGYVHVPSTGIDGQNELVRQFMGQRHKDALIIDERWNSGGQIPTRFIELLDRPTTNFWATRSGRDWEWPPVGHRGPKAMLINHAAGSGGDAFPYYFRQSGLGKLIGTRTWGGLVGLSGQPPLIDGASPTVPTFAFYEKDGTWGVEGHGVAPDIEVLDDPAKMCHGEDPQLETAIAHLLAELESWQPPGNGRPDWPDRSGAGLPERDK
ncbi:MAG: peptidase S41 [bacterium]|nr:peptidase S41 [bacterium]